MPEDHLRRVASFQRHSVDVLDFCESIADERMPQRVVFPRHLCLASSANHCFEEAIFAVRPDAITAARRYRQPLREIVRERDDAPRSRLCLVRGNFDESWSPFEVIPVQAQDFRRAQSGECGQCDARRNFR